MRQLFLSISSMSRSWRLLVLVALAALLASLLASVALVNTAAGVEPPDQEDPADEEQSPDIPDEVKGQPVEDLLSAGGLAAKFGPDTYEGPGNNNPEPGPMTTAEAALAL